MKRIYNNYFLVGLFTLIIGGLAIFALLVMGGKHDNSDTYFSYFDNVTGLSYGNPVYYEGYRVGQVEHIIPETKHGKLVFKTEYTLIDGWNVPQDSVTKIQSSGLLSDMSLSIIAGKSTQYIKPGDEIKGEAGDDVMATVTQLANDFSTLNKEKITPLIDLIYERVDTISKSLETDIPNILSSVDKLLKDMNVLVKDANQLLSQGNVQGVTDIINNLNDLSKDLAGAGDWVENTLNQANDLIKSGQKLIDNSDNKVATILDSALKMVDAFSLKAETIANELESASMNLNEATETIRKHPSSLVFDKKSKIKDEDL
ncbi:MAG TPA: MCE family protein [Oceanospirillales bacterium]|nr:MCE family protein [Oceanospirillales bacterium]